MRVRFACIAGVLGALTSGCTALIDLDQYELAECTELRLDLFDFADPHSVIPVEIRALAEVADDQPRLESVVRLVPFGAADNLSIRVPDALTTADTLLAFYADVNLNGIADASPSDGGPDHSWIIDGAFVCADQDATVVNEFVHNFDFVSIDPAHLPYRPISTDDAFLVIQGVEAPLETFELRVAAVVPGAPGEPETVLTVGVFRRPKVQPGDPRESEGEFEVRLPGIVADATYRIELWNDTDGDQAYDAPPTDQAWTFEIQGADLACPTSEPLCPIDTANTFVANTDYTDIGGIYVTVIP